MNLPRRRFLHVAAGAAVLPAVSRVVSQSLSGEILDMATQAGAAALDLPVGAIAAGKKADLVLVRLDGFHIQPSVADTILTNLVHAARGSDVAMVMVDGRIVVEGGRLADTRWDGLNARARQVGLDLLQHGRQTLS